MYLTLSGARYNLKLGDKIIINIGDEKITKTIYNIEISGSSVSEIGSSSVLQKRLDDQRTIIKLK